MSKYVKIRMVSKVRKSGVEILPVFLAFLHKDKTNTIGVKTNKWMLRNS